MIEVINLKKSYGNKQALKGISFEVKSGEIFGFLGPNGAGKTTTIKILTGQLSPDSGQSKILGMDSISDKKRIQYRMGIVPENTNLYERLTVQQNLEFFCRLYGCDISNVDKYLKLVDLIDQKKTQVKKLSKGMKQRILLARALLHQPEVLFLDEPTSGLDPASANNIHKILVHLNTKGTTILLTSHNMEEADKLCHKVAFINCGLIAACDTPKNLKLKYATRKMHVLIEHKNKLEEKILDMDGKQSAALVAQWMRENKIKSIHSCEPTLSDIFMKVTRRESV